jgi:UDP-N-acetylmuramate dehydrogenase
MDLRYRHSNLTDDSVVVAARFRTTASSEGEGEQVLREITRWRKEHQPGGTLNAGSVFKNPPTVAAGRLIDELGLKGFAVGGASVSERHANFFVAGPDATAQDVYDLVVAVQQRVAAATGIWLEPEIRFAGTFAEVGAA